jgi:hypothetical protein
MSIPIEHAARMWWNIAYVYQGKQQQALAFGETPEDADVDLKKSLPFPELAVVVAVTPIPECTGVEAMSSAFCSCG